MQYRPGDLLTLDSVAIYHPYKDRDDDFKFQIIDDYTRVHELRYLSIKQELPGSKYVVAKIVRSTSMGCHYDDMILMNLQTLCSFFVRGHQYKYFSFLCHSYPEIS